MLMTESSNCSS